MIVAAQCTYGERIAQTMQWLNKIKKFSDRIVIIIDTSVTDEQKTLLTDNGCEVYRHEWNDNFPENRNRYLEKLQHGDWCFTSDPDEWPSDSLCNDITSICKEADNTALAVLYINCHDAMHTDESEDESNTDFFKHLLFKYYKGVRYQGIGEEATVHERLIMPIGSSSSRLDPKYYYVHHKFTWEVWERAFRNVFIAGGGVGNWGKKNPSWEPLRKICKDIGITKWIELRKYMKIGNIDPKLKTWLIENRRDGNEYEHEMAEAFRWYFEFLHPEENTDKISVIKKDDSNTDPDELFVENHYWNILGRAPDIPGIRFYTEAIKSGNLDKKQLAGVFRRSEEFENKFPSPLVKNIEAKIGSVSACIMGYRSGIHLIKQSISVLSPHVDAIHIQGDDFNRYDEIDLFHLSNKVTVHIEPWEDHFSDYKNKCCARADTEWIIILDHDEIPTKEFAEHIRDMIKDSQGGMKYNIIGFDVIDERYINNTQVANNRTNNGKALMHYNFIEPYVGNPHVWMKQYPWKVFRSHHAYRHVKEDDDELKRSVRNVFLGGGGDNSRHSVWKDFREVMSKNNINTYKEFDDILRTGKINDEIMAAIKKMHAVPWKDDELKDILRYYYILHPEEEK